MSANMDTQMTQTPSPLSQQDALQGLVDYCKEKDVFITPSIAAQSFPGRGLGMYTLKPIKKGERLIHVPTKSLFTTASVPDSFLSKSVRKHFSVHCALAAYLAFGADEDLKQYRRWMATWPKIEEFTAQMPVLWKEDFRKSEGVARDQTDDEDEDRARKRRKMASDRDGLESSNAPKFSRSPGIDDLWLTQIESALPTEYRIHIAEQAFKIRSCIDTVEKYFPALKIRDTSSHADYLRFLYMWCCVNTRCFYYLRPGQAPPDDSNEAMALCPFQDLFNHSDAKGCMSIFDKRGFFVKADKDYDEGEELFVKYGRHSNDILWMEYGFMMDNNKDDLLKIDRVVLSAFDKYEKEELEMAGYITDYTIKRDGVCFRTVMASYLGVLGDEQWWRMASGGVDPETNTSFAMLKLKAKKRIIDWLLLVRKEAEENIKVLLKLEDEEDLLTAFVGQASLTDEQRQSRRVQIATAYARRDSCLRRWKQVFDMCMSAARYIEEDCPGCFLVDDTAGRSKEDLLYDSKRFVESIER